MLHATRCTARLLPKARCTKHLLPVCKAVQTSATLAASRTGLAQPDLGSWPNQQHQFHSTAMGDVVDLTLSDSDEEMPVLQNRQQAPAPTAATQSTAAAPASLPPTAEAAAEDVQARNRIMDFARGKAAHIAQARAAAAAATGTGLSTADAGAGDDHDPVLGGPAKRAKPSPAAETAPDAAAQADDAADAATEATDSAAAAGSPTAAAAAAGGGISNADLRALHEARLRRQQQQDGGNTPQEDAQLGDSPAGSAPAASPAAAAAAAAAAGGSRRRSRSPAARSAGAKPAAGTAAAAGAGGGSSSISLLTYNVWFKEEVAVLERMIGLGDIVRRAGLPTFICLQEVTPLILEILANMEWWQQYTASPHPYDMTYFTMLLVKRSAAPSLSNAAFKHHEFRNSVMARGLRSAKVSIGEQQLTVATTHLESPIPPQAFYSKERQQQMAEALRALEDELAGNVLFAGDMNWEDKRDGAPPLPDSWVDAWATLQPGRPGITYDAKNNPMLPFKGTPPLRLDRILCKLRDWRLGSIELLGTQALPGITYTHRFRNGGSKELPVLPSDHFGLLLRLEPV